MPLNLELMQSTVRLVGSIKDDSAPRGEKRGAIGTGFLVTVESETLEGRRYGYVVTAEHNIWDQTQVEVQAPDPTTNGTTLHPAVEVTDWRQPLPDVDLAIAPFDDGNHSDRAYSALTLENHVLPPLTYPMLGATIFYIGILIPLDRPMARSGTIGALNQEGIKHKDHYRYTAHLLDCRSYGGFSGSPCFVELAYASLTPIPVGAGLGAPVEQVGRVHYNVKFCGMLTQHLEDNERDRVPEASRYGVAVMLPGDAIWEALMSKDMKAERREWDAEIVAAGADQDGPQLENISRSKETEYDRFEALTRQLAQTPKPEQSEKGQSESQ